MAQQKLTADQVLQQVIGSDEESQIAEEVNVAGDVLLLSLLGLALPQVGLETLLPSENASFLPMRPLALEIFLIPSMWTAHHVSTFSYSGMTSSGTYF